MNRTIMLLIIFLGSYFEIWAQRTEYTIKSDISYYPESICKKDKYINERCKLDIYYPVNVSKFPTVVWFHGGGLTAGNKEIPEALKNKGICVIGVNYRLSPRAKSPEYINDAAAAVAWVFNNIETFKGDSSLIFVSGHSAGGYLTAMIGLDKQWLRTKGVDANRIAGLIPLSAQTITHFTIRGERSISDKQPIIDSLAPLFHVRADAPPLLLITGDRELEMLGRYEENAYLMRMMKVVGHKNTRLLELQGYGHGMTEPAFPLLVSEIWRLSTNKRAIF